MKQNYEVFLTYPNGAISHSRKSHEKSRIIKELNALINQRELLDTLASKITIKDRGKVLFECDSKDFDAQMLEKVKWRKQGGIMQYPNKINVRVSDEMKSDIEKTGNGSFTDGLREMYAFWKENAAQNKISSL